MARRKMKPEVVAAEPLPVAAGGIVTGDIPQPANDAPGFVPPVFGEGEALDVSAKHATTNGADGLTVEYVPTASLVPYANNAKMHPDEQVDQIAASIDRFGFADPIGVWTNPDGEMEIVEGHGRILAANKLGIDTVPIIRLDYMTDEERRAYVHVHNQTTLTSGFNMDVLNVEFAALGDFDWEQFGFDISLDLDSIEDTRKDGSLRDRFVVPPFSVFDARQGYWSERKRAWNRLIGDVGQARTQATAYIKMCEMQYGPKVKTDTSILDPVLAEICVRYFVPDGGSCFDVFAGDTVFGYVASYLGHEFTGIEIRQEQVDFNNTRVDGMPARYICDDGRNVLSHVGENSQDFLFSCPPYFNLEVYSDMDGDASNQKSFEEFYSILDAAFTDAIRALKDDSFAVIVIGNIRNKENGGYYDFRGCVVDTFIRNGMVLYNDAVLLTPLSTACIRANSYMKSRKLVSVHQSVLVFYKGGTARIHEKFGNVEVDERLGGFLASEDV